MGQVTSLFVHKVIRQAHPSIDRRPLLEAVGVDPDAPVDPAKMVSDSDYYSFFEALARSDPDAITLPLRTGASMRCDDYGAFGLAFKSALDLRGSYARAERYARVLGSVATYEVEPTNEGGLMHLHRAGERRLGLRLSNEATIASIAAISEEVTAEPFQALAVYFKHSAPANSSEHESHFGCPVHFDTDKDALLLAPETLQQINKLGDTSISKFFEAHLEAQLKTYADDTSLDRRVRIQVSQSLSEGVPKIGVIAERLGMSERTLQRRLSDRGFSYQSLVDAARRELAERLLAETSYALAEVAFLTGFSEQSAFNRAFKRWAGETPRSYRLKASPG